MLKVVKIAQNGHKKAIKCQNVLFKRIQDYICSWLRKHIVEWKCFVKCYKKLSNIIHW